MVVPAMELMCLQEHKDEDVSAQLMDAQARISELEQAASGHAVVHAALTTTISELRGTLQTTGSRHTSELRALQDENARLRGQLEVLKRSHALKQFSSPPSDNRAILSKMEQLLGENPESLNSMVDNTLAGLLATLQARVVACERALLNRSADGGPGDHTPITTPSVLSRASYDTDLSIAALHLSARNPTQPSLDELPAVSVAVQSFSLDSSHAATLPSSGLEHDVNTLPSVDASVKAADSSLNSDSNAHSNAADSHPTVATKSKSGESITTPQVSSKARTHIASVKASPAANQSETPVKSKSSNSAITPRSIPTRGSASSLRSPALVPSTLSTSKPTNAPQAAGPPKKRLTDASPRGSQSAVASTAAAQPTAHVSTVSIVTLPTAPAPTTGEAACDAPPVDDAVAALVVDPALVVDTAAGVEDDDDVYY